MENQSTLNCSGTMTSILLEGVREMIGPSGKISQKEFDLPSGISDSAAENYSNIDSLTQEDLFSLLNSAPIIFGERGASGIALRIGEAGFRCFLRINGEQYLLTDLAYRLMNSQRRIIFGLKQLAKFAYQNCGANIEISENDRYWYWTVVVDKSFLNWNKLFTPYTIGLLREFFIWTSGGRYYPMEEILETNNSKILFQIAINKQPLGN